MKVVETTRQLVRAFGRPTEMLALLAPDAVWHLHIGSRAPGGSHVGRSAIEAVIRQVFGSIYDPATVRITIHDAFGNDERAVVRFRLEARTAWGSPYSNEYALIARGSGGRIAEVWEFLDGISASEQLAPPARVD